MSEIDAYNEQMHYGYQALDREEREVKHQEILGRMFRRAVDLQVEALKANAMKHGSYGEGSAADAFLQALEMASGVEIDFERDGMRLADDRRPLEELVEDEAEAVWAQMKVGCDHSLIFGKQRRTRVCGLCGAREDKGEL
jgi:hypothetical protein